MTMPDEPLAGIPPPSIGDDDWNCAGAISPRKDAQIEFRSKETSHIRRGRFTGSGYVDTEDSVEYSRRMVREWRYHR